MPLLNPCPTCGFRFDFPLTGCMTFVDDMLEQTCDKCPECGTPVVVEGPLPKEDVFDPLVNAMTPEEKVKVRIIDLPVSVRCRARINKLNVETLGDLLKMSVEEVRTVLADYPEGLTEIEEMLEEHGLRWSD